MNNERIQHFSLQQKIDYKRTLKYTWPKKYFNFIPSLMTETTTRVSSWERAYPKHRKIPRKTSVVCSSLGESWLLPQWISPNFGKLVEQLFCRIYVNSYSCHFEKQKQPPEVFYKKKMLLKFRNIHRKTSVFELLFNKVAGL